jgi:hypothetical protein
MSRHFARLLPGVGMLAILAGSATAAYADPILIQSGNPGPGQTQTCANSMNSDTTCVDVTPHPAWQPNNPNFTPGAPGFTNLTPSGAVWVSFGDTGYNGSLFAPPGTTMTYTYTFMAPPNAQFIGRVWSDDTSMIYLDGLFVGGGTDTVGGGTTYGAGYMINAFLGPGTGAPSTDPSCMGCTPHTLGSNPTGQGGSGTDTHTNPGPDILVIGEVSPSSVPEPATLALFGMGLIGAGVMRRRRKA